MTSSKDRHPPAPLLADDDRKHRNGGGAPGTAIITKTKPQTKRPSLYRVLLLNDDYTPMDFVVGVLQQVFAMTREQATHVMLQVHRSGMGTCGVFTKEVADTKVAQVVDLASQHQHPLQCTMEPE